MSVNVSNYEKSGTSFMSAQATDHQQEAGKPGNATEHNRWTKEGKPDDKIAWPTGDQPGFYRSTLKNMFAASMQTHTRHFKNILRKITS